MPRGRLPWGDLLRSPWFTAAGIFVLAAVPRVVYLIVSGPVLAWHWELATSLLTRGTLEYHGAVTTDYTLVYPLFLAGLRTIVDDALAVHTVEALLASAAAVVLMWLGEAMTGRRRIGILAGVLYALYPLLIHHAANEIASPLVTPLLIAFAYTFVTAQTVRGAALAGIWLGAAAAARSAVLPLLVLAPCVMLMDGRRRAAVGLLSAFLVIAPGIARNYSLNGSFLPTRSGINLLIGNAEYVAVPQFDPDVLEGYGETIASWEGLDAPPGPALDAARNEALTRYTVAYMIRHPWRTAWLKLKYVWYFYSPRLVPYRDVVHGTSIELAPNGVLRAENGPPRSMIQQMAYTIPYLFVVLMTGVAFVHRRLDLRRDAILWCIVLVFTAVYSLYFPAMRYRVPMEFVLIFFAAVGLDALAGYSAPPGLLSTCRIFNPSATTTRRIATSDSARPRRR